MKGRGKKSQARKRRAPGRSMRLLALILMLALIGNQQLYLLAEKAETEESLPETVPDAKEYDFKITYNEAVRLVKDGEDHPTEKLPMEGYTAYYGTEIVATIAVKEVAIEEEEEADAEEKVDEGENPDVGEEKPWLADFVLTLETMDSDGETATTDVTAQINWEDAAEAEYVGIYTIAAEGSYVLTATLGEEVYISPTLVLDTTAPKLNFSYKAAVKTEQEDETVPVPVSTDTDTGRKYFNEDIILELTLEDENLRVKELQESILSGLKTVDSREVRVENTAAETAVAGWEATRISQGILTLEIPLTTEANYAIPLAYTDLAGNAEPGMHMELVTVDQTAPVLTLRSETASGVPVQAVRYQDDGFWFADEEMTVTVMAEDATTDVQGVNVIVTDETGEEHVFPCRESEQKPDASLQIFFVEIPPEIEAEDFKGTIWVRAKDRCTNEAQLTRGVVVESAQTHEEAGSAVLITETAPSRTVAGVNYYNTDIALKLILEDSYSGLKNCSYQVGSGQMQQIDHAKEAGLGFEGEPSREITWRYEEELVLQAAANDQNDVKVWAGFTDNAGHGEKVEASYNVDVTAPEITVEYDLNEPANGSYYKDVRTATVTIRERNFDEQDVEFSVTNTEGILPSVSGWSRSGGGNDTLYSCTVTFYGDGDYTFTVDFQDMAGNRADYGRVDVFTVDRTQPQVTVTYDNMEGKNSCYYAGNRIAVIDIDEHNFDSGLIDVILTVENSEAEVPQVLGWTQNGDHHTARIHFREDGAYTLAIEGVDLAENQLPGYGRDYFVIDQTAPELKIFNIGNHSANSGEVRPGVWCFDRNYAPESVEISLSGYKNGVREIKGKTVRTGNGLEIKLEDFAYVAEEDDLYTLEASAGDLAGNSSRVSVVFSVNRFGSVYTFDEKTEALVGERGEYYVNQGRELVVIETNVDTVEFQEITCNLNGKLRTLREGVDYTVDRSGSEAGWKQYIYRVDEGNFEEEGLYLVTFYSRDRASNESDNSAKGKRIEFVVDKTSPSIVISGVDHEEQYRESSRQITLDVEDNVCLAGVKVVLNGVETIYEAAEAQGSDGRLTFRVEGANQWQELMVTAYDEAGNEQNSQTIRFLITPNLLAQFFMNRDLVGSVLGITLGVLQIAGVIWLWRTRKKERKN
ncbi:MAG: hypothetical protein IJ036_01065 [Lachnospiraceae bacterium]|nr:hypothetical protein [Lachnospiraceae bacterium]